MSTNAAPTHRIWLVICLAAATVLLVICYRPGLQGTFLFDDAANLPALGADGPVDNAAAFLRYITSGHADPIGRPVSMLSFLLDARDWPAAPYAFKRTNLIIHGINALLLGVVLRWLGRLEGLPKAQADFAALLAATIWAVHPFFVSTVLYVVQREAMLPATFTLLGLLCWLQARAKSQAPRTSGLWLILGVGSCTALAALSKANGLLLPLLILACEATVPAAAPDFRRRIRWIVAPPAIALVAFLAWTALAAAGDGIIPIRGWSIWQRLMTEPSILLDYLSQLWLFKPTDSSLLHDDIQIATSLWRPWYTIPSIVACAALVVSAWMVRKRHPFAAMAVLFYFAGHLMESSSLALELYFDHRNYLPAMLMFWPLAVAITGIRSRLHAIGAATLMLAALTFLTLSNATLWGNPLAQAHEWAERHPNSARAQAYAAQVDMDAGRIGQARERIDAARTRFTREPQIALNLIDIHCATGSVTTADIAYANTSFRSAQREPGPLLLNWFTRAVDSGDDPNCAGLTKATLSEILTAAEENPRITGIPGRLQDIEHIRGLMLLTRGDTGAALALFNHALALDPNPATALRQAALLGSAGEPALGLAHLRYFSRLPTYPRHRSTDGMPWVHDVVLERQQYWPTEIDHLSAALEAEARKKNG